MNIVIHIERLMLDGIPVERAHHGALRNALTGELSRLLAGGVHPGLLSGGALAAVPGGSIELSRGASAARLGGQLARAVHGGIGAYEPSGR
jgi:hypothetical protein